MGTEHSPLPALPPTDGRYAGQLAALPQYFSEQALIRARVEVEIRYLIALSETGVIGKLSTADRQKLLKIADLSLKDAEEIKRIEATTAHDLKAVEYFLQKKVPKELVEFVHFGLTSDDVNNLAYGITFSAFLKEQYLPQVRKLQAVLRKYALQYAELPMLSRTHGQPASPTTVG